eukprot:g13742.t1
MASPAPEQLHAIMVGIGTSGGTQAELVFHAKRRLNGQGMRLVAMWAFIGRVLHLYPIAAEIFDRKQWSTYLYWHSFAVLCFLGFSPAQIKMLLEDNCGKDIDKNLLYKITYSTQLLDAIDPRLMAAKLLRSAAGKWAAVTGDVSMLSSAVATLPLREDDAGFDEMQKMDVIDFHAADEALRRRLKPAQQDLTENPHHAGSAARPSVPMWIPTPAKCDFLSSVLLKSGRSVEVTQQTIPLSELRNQDCVTILPDTDAEANGAVAICDGKTIARVGSNEFCEVMSVSRRDELRFLAASRKIVQDVALSPMASSPSFRIWIVSDISSSGKESGTFRDLWRLLVMLPTLQFYMAKQLPPSFCLKIDRDVPRVVFHIHYVELASRDAGVKWPKRNMSVRFNLTEREEALRRGESQRWVAKYYPIPVEMETSEKRTEAPGEVKAADKTLKRSGKRVQDVHTKAKRKKQTNAEQELAAGAAGALPHSQYDEHAATPPIGEGNSEDVNLATDSMVMSQESGLSSQF